MFTKDDRNNTVIGVFVDRLNRMFHLVAMPKSITAEDCARACITNIEFLIYSDDTYPTEIVVSRLSQANLVVSPDKRLNIYKADHPRKSARCNVQNCVFEEILRGDVHYSTC